MSNLPSADHIVFDNVEVKYSEYVFGLRSVSLSIQRGEFVFLLGQTGSGKSTLLKLLSKEVRSTAGSVSLWGRDLEGVPDRDVPLLRRQMGIVPQDYGLLPRKRVYENVAYAMRAIGASRKEVRVRVPEILERVHIGHRADAFPHQLSGGEQQRVAIGRALINNPPLLIADEPTGNLDAEHSWEIMELLLELNHKGTTVLVASHDLMVVERVGRRIVTMQQGKVVGDMTPDAVPAATIMAMVQEQMDVADPLIESEPPEEHAEDAFDEEALFAHPSQPGVDLIVPVVDVPEPVPQEHVMPILAEEIVESTPEAAEPRPDEPPDPAMSWAEDPMKKEEADA